jgi:hypothetical protein
MQMVNFILNYIESLNLYYNFDLLFIDDYDDSITTPSTKRVMTVSGWSFSMINSFSCRLVTELLWNVLRITGSMYILFLGVFQVKRNFLYLNLYYLFNTDVIICDRFLVCWM